jgi:hypothetical protein
MDGVSPEAVLNELVGDFLANLILQVDGNMMNQSFLFFVILYYSYGIGCSNNAD